jgi:hypothetical protein
MKRALAISRLVLPAAASFATRASASVIFPATDRRPPIRASSARALSAHRGAPSLSKGRQRINGLVVLGSKLIAVGSETRAFDDQGAVWIGKVKAA